MNRTNDAVLRSRITGCRVTQAAAWGSTIAPHGTGHSHGFPVSTSRSAPHSPDPLGHSGSAAPTPERVTRRFSERSSSSIRAPTSSRPRTGGGRTARALPLRFSRRSASVGAKPPSVESDAFWACTSRTTAPNATSAGKPPSGLCDTSTIISPLLANSGLAVDAGEWDVGMHMNVMGGVCRILLCIHHSLVIYDY